MNNTWKDIIGITALAIGLVGFIVYEHGNDIHVKVYDCSMAEISPDYPIQVKEQCRKIKVIKI